MIVLDTDHITVLRYTDHARCQALVGRLESATDRRQATTVITLEEQARGWLAEIGRRRDVHEQVAVYERLTKLLDYLRVWEILPFDARAADRFQELREQRIRIGSQDLKIASIALVNDALLLSANVRDFKKVPDLRVEDWLA